MKKLLNSTNFRIWLALVGSSTIVIGVAYVMVQQSTRLAVNDLPLQKAQEVKRQLDSGAKAADIVSAATVNLESDTNVFVVVTDTGHHVLAGSAKLGGQVSLPPSGVFDYTAQHGSDHITWQPAKNVRLATEVLSYKGGFIVSGQSLKPAEDRISKYTLLAMFGWLVMLAWSSFLLLPKKF